VLAEQLGSLIKVHRMRRGATQEDLARAAGVSRTIISNLEQCKGRPVQTDVLDRLLIALDINPQMTDSSAYNDARKLARLEQQRKLEQRRIRHLRLAIGLAQDALEARAMVSKARERVALWRRNNTCSPLYIERWSELLKLPPRKLAKAMSSLGEWEDALFQNSPWSWAWT
jgi:transcriptional regulator with XRE-family HTH domain